MFDEIVSIPNLYRAAYAAAKGKRHSDQVAFFNFRMEHEIERLHEELCTGRYRHGSYDLFKIYEPKERDIAKAPFRDRVVHHAVHDVIEPVIDRTFIFDSYACRMGKGTHVAIERAQSFLDARLYCLHGDIKKYFPSIDRDIVKVLLRRHIKDARLFDLFEEIIDSARYVFPGTMSAPGAARGLPIGNLTSQFMANLYLHELDHFVKHTLKCRYYLRYMDDFLLYDDDPVVLGKWRRAIAQMLASRLNLCLHPDKTQIFAARKGLTFLGFYLSRGRRRIAAKGMQRLRRRLKAFRYLKKLGDITESDMANSMLCWRAHSSYANAFWFLRSRCAWT